MVTIEQPATTLGEKIRHLLDTRNHVALRRWLLRHNFADVADVMENYLNETEVVACFQLLNVAQAAQILPGLSEDRQIACLSSLPVGIGSQILRLMPSDDAVDILQELDSRQSQKILEEMPFDLETRSIHHLLREAPDTAAGIMATDFLQVSIEKTVGDALGIVKTAEDKDFVYYCYLVDTHEVLHGVVSLKMLIQHPETTPLKEIAHFDIKTILETADQEAVANLFRKYYNLLAMPVVDADGHLRGIITLDDIVDIIDEESSEDIYRTSGIQIQAVDEKNLLTGPTLKAVKARMPWLTVTLFGQFLAATIIASFHHTVATAVIAISFMPLLSGLSGNMGTQSETIAVRGLALNLITRDNISKKVFRELKVGLITGGTFSIGVGVLSFLQYHHMLLSVLLSGAIIVSLCLSSVMGIMLPYAYQRYFRQDPAGVGGPLITTLMDIMSFSTYLYVISLLLDRMI
jgi:magnesium transporter